MGKVIFILFLGLAGTAYGLETKKKEADNLADSSVTSYSTVVIHHPQNKKNNLVKEGEEGRSQSYFKVKRLRASTLPPHTNVRLNGHNGGDFRQQNGHNGGEFRAQASELKSEFKNQEDVTKKNNNDFKPSQYLPETEVHVSFRGDKDQSGQAARTPEYTQAKDQPGAELKKSKYKNEAQSEKETTKWRTHYNHRHQPTDEKKRTQKQKPEETQYHREIYRESPRPNNEEKVHFYHSKPENAPTNFGYDAHNAIHNVPAQLTNPFEHIAGIPEQRLRPIPPPGMSDELIETLLSQQPQTFDSDKKIEPLKKPKGQSFKVGYSIGFGGGDDVVMGRPKDVKLHINGRNSVWKNLPNGIEMSEEVDKRRPMGLKIADSSTKGNGNVLKNDVYYMQNFQPDTSVPTAGRTSFNHQHALTSSNTFDFSNAVDPKWFKQPRALDMGNIYQSLGYPSPLPVLLPGGPSGEGTMVHAIVIPIEQLAGFDYNWANLPQVPMVPVAAQPVAQALTLSPVVTTSPIVQTPVPHHVPQSLNHGPSAHHAPLHGPSSPPHHGPSSPYHGPSSIHKHEKQRFKPRAPKAKDSLKQGSFNSAPIIVAPTAPHHQSEMQQELNNILAEEMKRKNNRVPAVGLRPPRQF